MTWHESHWVLYLNLLSDLWINILLIRLVITLRQLLIERYIHFLEEVGLILELLNINNLIRRGNFLLVKLHALTTKLAYGVGVEYFSGIFVVFLNCKSEVMSFRGYVVYVSICEKGVSK